MAKIISVISRRHYPRMPEGVEYIGRPSPLGNPFQVGRDGTRGEVIERYRLWLEEVLRFTNDDPDFKPEYVKRMESAQAEFVSLCIKYEKSGMLTLMCWCSPLPCHGDVLAERIKAACDG